MASKIKKGIKKVLGKRKPGKPAPREKGKGGK